MKKNYHAETITLGEGVVEWQEKKLEWMRYEYPIRPGDVIYDLGAFEGEFGSKLRAKYGNEILVTAFDPSFNLVAWTHDGEISLGGSGNTQSTFNGTNEKKYHCVDIARFIKDDETLADRDIRLMKINIEGAEYAILNHLIATETIGRIEFLQVQFHLVSSFDAKLVYHVIQNTLRRTHVREWYYPFCWESWRRKDINRDPI